MPDYDALAEKYGGKDVPDYDAIAAKYGGGDKESTYAGRVGQAAMRGLRMGPYGVPVALGAQGLEEFGNLMEKAGYRAGGAVTDALSSAGLRNPLGGAVPPEVAAGSGFVANQMISNVLPAIAGGSATRSLAAPVMRRMSEYLMRRALNPTVKQWTSGQGPQAVRTMLDEPIGASGKLMPGANVHEVGLEQLKGKANEIFDQALDAASRGDSQAFTQLTEKMKDLGSAFELAEKAAGKTSQIGGIGMFYHRLVTLLAYLGSHSPLVQSMVARGLNIGKNVLPRSAGAAGNASLFYPQGQAPNEYQTLEGRLP